MNERRLTDAQKSIIERWADAGAPEGDPKDLPATPRYTDPLASLKPVDDAVLAGLAS